MKKNNEKLIKSIKDNIEEYWSDNNTIKFDASNPRVNLHEPTFGPEEVMAMLEVMLSTKVTMGPKVLGFEKEIADYFNVSEAVTNNSGSSANLLAISALTNPKTKNRLKEGDEVIVPALSWSTTVWPLIQHKLVPVFVDINPDTLNIDPQAIKEAISEKTKAIMIVPVYGNPCDMDSILAICDEFNLQLIEDNCESLGAYYDGRLIGSFGRVGTYSTYFSHHITTLEGGICVSNDFELAELMRIIRAHGWVRETKEPQKYYDSYPKIDKKFLFVNLGYNLRLTEVGGAMGSVQLPKLLNFVNNRRNNARILLEGLTQYSSLLSFQKETPKGLHSWFGFPIVINPNLQFDAKELRQYLESNGIETRPIIAGNIAKQPAVTMYPHRISGDLKNSSHVMSNGLAVACHQSLTKEELDHILKAFHLFFVTKDIS
ncbi:aminotransferase class I/II-fold pyridoxal phosphate-dependent enzyme [Candidatus Thioglobus sp.]|nr:aminotransferase class I/II-fold pyridoxal phosphate-dependent enzyme [Candidatus Thioglobus sp.]